MNQVSEPAHAVFRPSLATHYVRGIDGLRALAVVAVLAFHLSEALLPGGFIGVDVFFVISGFVVTASVSRMAMDNVWRFQIAFYARRVIRIIPALLICLIVTCLAHSLFVPAVWLSNLSAKTGNAAFFGFSNIVLAFNRDSYFAPASAFNPFVHTWSLGVEEQFYLLFPLVFFLAARWLRQPAVVMLALCAASLVACAWLQAMRYEFAFYLMPARFWELGLGSALFLTAHAWTPALARLPRLAVQLLYLAAISSILVAIATTSASTFPFPSAIMPVAATALLIALLVARPDAGLGRPFCHPLAVFVGAISYSLYLWHWPVIVIMRWTVGLQSASQFAFAAALSVLLAWATYRWVETPVRSSPRIALLPRTRVVGAGVAGVIVASLVGGAVFKLQPELSLSVTTDASTWIADRDTPLAPWPPGCTIASQRSNSGGLLTFTMKPQGCAPARSERVFVAGDSHATAYVLMLQQFAVESGREVILHSFPGCAFLSLRSSDPGPAGPCWAVQQRIVSKMASELKPGDTVFLASLRVPRFRDQSDDGPSIVPSPPPAPSPEMETKILGEARQLLAPLQATGARILLEAPKPVFRSPPFRCADWFNATNPVCAEGFAVARADLDPWRKPVLARMGELASSMKSVKIWDPFSVLCPGDPCTAFIDGKPLFYDGDHLSTFGNRILLPAFSKAVGDATR